MSIIGLKVIHKTFGKGKIVDLSGDYITVSFIDGNKDFSYPDSFKLYLEGEDSKTKEIIKYDIKQKSMDSHDVEIYEILKRRNIKKLVHFTRFEHIDSIKKHGILPRTELAKINPNYCFNDESRYDGKMECISLSITDINKFVLQSFAEKYKIENWAVISINPSILYETKSIAYYCDTNAANHEISGKLRNFSESQKLQTSNALELMFSQKISHTTTFGELREFYRNRHRPNQTTDLQAEILYNGIIPASYILNIETKHVVISNNFEEIFDDLTF